MGFFQKRFLATLLLMFALSTSAQQTNQDFELGKIKYYLSDWDGAITNFTKSIESSFDLHNSYSYRAYARAMKGDASGAMADCSQLIQLEPSYASSYYWRSRVKVELTNYDGALTDFRIGIKMDPKSRPADLARELSMKCYIRAYKEYRVGDLDGAMTNLNEAIFIAPTNANPYELRGWLRVMQKHYESAITDEYFAIKYFSSSIDAREARAWARYGRGDVSGAIEDCTKVTQLYSNLFSKYPDTLPEFEAATTPGLLCFIHGDFEKSIVEWNKFASANTNLPPPLREFIQSWIEKAKTKLLDTKK